jgi:hypothetical protein
MKEFVDVQQLWHTHQFITLVWLQCNDMVESFIKTIKQELTIMVALNIQCWDIMLPHILFGYHCVIQATTLLLVLIRHIPRLTINNNFNSLCDGFDEHVGLEVLAEQMVHKMQLFTNVHKSLLKNIEQDQKKQRKVHAACKGLQIFDGFEENNKMKMCKPSKKKSLVYNWEGPYIFMDYKDGKGPHMQDHGSWIFIVKDFNEQHWECVKKDLQLYHFAN